MITPNEAPSLNVYLHLDAVSLICVYAQFPSMRVVVGTERFPHPQPPAVKTCCCEKMQEATIHSEWPPTLVKMQQVCRCRNRRKMTLKRAYHFLVGCILKIFLQEMQARQSTHMNTHRCEPSLMLTIHISFQARIFITKNLCTFVE